MFTAKRQRDHAAVQSVDVKLRPMASWPLVGRQPSGSPRPERGAAPASLARAHSATPFQAPPVAWP